MCSNFYEIWHLVQIEHVNYQYGTWNWWSWTKIIASGKFCPNTEICSDFYKIWHSQQMEHANYEYNTRRGHGSRCVARNFWGQGRFLKIRTQIHDSSERLNYIQTLLRTSLKNNYLYQILINLASIFTRAYNFMIKRISWGFNIFTNKNTRCYVSLHILYIAPSLSRDHQ